MKTLFPFLLLLTIVSGVQSQDIVSLQEIFRASYAAEADSNFDKSINALKVQYDESSYLMNVRLGWLYYLNGEYYESIDYYRKAISVMPYAVEAKLGIALPMSMLGNWEDIIGIYEEILTIDPQNAITNYRLGLIYYIRQNYEKALPYVQRVANMYPYDYYSVVLLGWINLQIGKTREARVLFEKALQIIPGDPSAQEGLQSIVN